MIGPFVGFEFLLVGVAEREQMMKPINSAGSRRPGGSRRALQSSSLVAPLQVRQFVREHELHFSIHLGQVKDPSAHVDVTTDMRKRVDCR